MTTTKKLFFLVICSALWLLFFLTKVFLFCILFLINTRKAVCSFALNQIPLAHENPFKFAKIFASKIKLKLNKNRSLRKGKETRSPGYTRSEFTPYASDNVSYRMLFCS